MGNNKGISVSLPLGNLAIAFIILKLCNVIDWSWWLVLLPILIPIGIWLLIIILKIVYEVCRY